MRVEAPAVVRPAPRFFIRDRFLQFLLSKHVMRHGCSTWPRRCGWVVVMWLAIGCGGGKPGPCMTDGGKRCPDAGPRDAGHHRDASAGIPYTGIVTVQGDIALCPSLAMSI